MAAAQSLSRRLQARRKAEGLSINQAAQQAGVSFHTFKRFEAGDIPPEYLTYERLTHWAIGDGAK